MRVADLIDQIRTQSGDLGGGQMSRQQVMLFLNSAATDYHDGGWFIPMEDDESLILLANTYDYDVPSGFALIQDIYTQVTVNDTEPYLYQIPRGHWSLRRNDGKVQLHFSSIGTLVVGKHLKIIGQRKVRAMYGDENEEVDNGMASLLRERAASYMMQVMSQGGSELANRRAQMGIFKRQLQRPFPSAEFRSKVDSKIVPIRSQ